MYTPPSLSNLIFQKKKEKIWKKEEEEKDSKWTIWGFPKDFFFFQIVQYEVYILRTAV